MADDGEIREPVPNPRDNVQTFIGLVLNVANLCKIQKIPELDHQVELLVRAAESYLWQKSHGGNKARDGKEKQRYIVIFKNRFRVSYDYDYPNTITPVELKLVEQLINNKLKPKHITADFFLGWFFDVFLVLKPNFNPANIKLTCSNLVWSEFAYDNQDGLKDKKEQALQESEALDLINQARAAIRQTEDLDQKTKIIELIKNYRDGSIMFVDFKRQVLDLNKAK